MLFLLNALFVLTESTNVPSLETIILSLDDKVHNFKKILSSMDNCLL